MCQKEVSAFHPCDVFTYVGPRLVPFFKTVIVYFVAWLPAENPSFLAAVVKCLPICCLIVFVASEGVSMKKEHDYQRRIFTGMLFSCIGDALLIWEDTHFITAMISFALAHIAYIQAFGFDSIKWAKSLPFYALFFAIFYLFYPSLKGLLLPCVFIYMWLICSMGWRAFASIDILDNVWSWTSLCGLIGAIFFMLSDFVIGIDKFVVPIFMSRVFTISTYYIAQLFIAMSAVHKTSIKVRMKKKN